MCGEHVSRIKHEELGVFGVEQSSSGDSSVTPATTEGDWCLWPLLSAWITAHLHYQQAVPVRGGCNLLHEPRPLGQLIYSVAVLAEQLFDMSKTYLLQPKQFFLMEGDSLSRHGDPTIRFNSSVAHPNGSFVAVDPGDSQPGGQVEHVLQNLLIELQVG